MPEFGKTDRTLITKKEFPYLEAEFDDLTYSGMIGPKSPNFLCLRRFAEAGLCSLETSSLSNGGVNVRAAFRDEAAKIKFYEELSAAGREELRHAEPEIASRYTPENYS